MFKVFKGHTVFEYLLILALILLCSVLLFSGFNKRHDAYEKGISDGISQAQLDYNAAYEKGYDDGYSDGYDAAPTEDREREIADGAYDEGYDDGYADGIYYALHG